MTAKEALPSLLKAYLAYYNVTEENVTPPFAAEAEFHSHEEQFFLVKAAKLSESESKEFVFFAATEHLTLADAKCMDETAWETGLSRVVPHDGHRSSDVVLVILADVIDEDAAKYLKKLRRYQSYRHTLHGWSHYYVIAQEMSTGMSVFNRMGRQRKKILRNIKN